MTTLTGRRHAAIGILAVGALLATVAPASAEETAAAVSVDATDEQAPSDFSPTGPATTGAPDASGTTSTTDGQRQTSELTSPVVLSGRGNGHGIGLSQYGARGQALAGRSAGTILRHYYQGSSIGTKGVSFDPRIGVALDRPSTRLVVRGGDATIRYFDRVRTSTSGQAWEVVVVQRTGECIVRTPHGGELRFPRPSGNGPCMTADPKADNATARIDVQVSKAGSWVRHGQYGRDAVVEAIPDSVSGTWRLDVVVEVPIEQYLYGLAEMPYSWERPALQAQAVAGRSFALYRLLQVGASPDRGCSCHLYDSQQDQVYDGWDREQGASWSRWKQAVDGTAGKVVVAPRQIGTRSDVVQAFYSSSSNGRTEAKHDLWGGERFPYLVSVSDGWALDPDTGNPHRSWEASLSRSTVAARVGLDRLDSVEVTDRSTSGAATEVRFRGVDGGSARTVTTSGSWVRSSFGLRSTTFSPVGQDLFADISGSVHRDNILWLAAERITDGCAPGLYCPRDPITRGQMAKLLVRAFDLPAATVRFDDTRGHLFEAEIGALAAAGVTTGCSDTKNIFCPNEPVTRAQMASFLARVKDLELGARTTFTDARSNLHSRAIEAIRRVGITQGCNPPDNTLYCPGRDVTREQMATFIRRAKEL